MSVVREADQIHPLTGPGPENLASILGRLGSLSLWISTITVPIVSQSAPQRLKPQNKQTKTALNFFEMKLYKRILSCLKWRLPVQCKLAREKGLKGRGRLRRVKTFHNVMKSILQKNNCYSMTNAILLKNNFIHFSVRLDPASIFHAFKSCFGLECLRT